MTWQWMNVISELIRTTLASRILMRDEAFSARHVRISAVAKCSEAIKNRFTLFAHNVQ